MRSIKFRAFRKDAKESGIVIGYSNDSDGEHVHIRFFTSDGKYQYEKWYKIDDPDIVLMQYTGLKDKSGSEVYEGDILSSIDGTFDNTCMGIVRAYKGMYVSFYGQDIIGRDSFDVLHTVCDSREVIGNIYENPELLTE